MKIHKIGQIFFTDKYGLKFAKSPQAVIFEKFVRVYFSTVIETSGKLVSIVKYADFTKDFKKVIKVSSNEILAQAKLGCFDEHGIFPFSPIRKNNEIWSYTTGITRRVSVSVDSGIGLVISKDGGETFVRLGDGPILWANLKEPYLIADAFVKNFNNKYYMWYIFGSAWKVGVNGEGERLYKIAQAESQNGIDWKRNSVYIIEEKNADECQALPTVIKYNNLYHMFFCHRNAFDFRKNIQHSYKLGYAWSKDLQTWTRNDLLINFEGLNNSWDRCMFCYPNVFKLDSAVYMLYNGNSFGEHGFGLAKIYFD